MSDDGRVVALHSAQFVAGDMAEGELGPGGYDWFQRKAIADHLMAMDEDDGSFEGSRVNNLQQPILHRKGKPFYHSIIWQVAVGILVLVAVLAALLVPHKTHTKAATDVTSSATEIRVEFVPTPTTDALRQFIASTSATTTSKFTISDTTITVVGANATADANALSAIAFASTLVDVAHLTTLGDVAAALCRRDEDSRCRGGQCSPGQFGVECHSCSSDCSSPNGRCDDGVIGTGNCLCSTSHSGANCAECAPGFFSGQCSPCPSCIGIGLETCSDGMIGDGHCLCALGFQGATCSACQSNFFGPNCQSCPVCPLDMVCQDGNAGSGACACRPGTFGPACAGRCLDCGAHGHCNDGLTGNGTCACTAPFIGDQCNRCPPLRFGADCFGECQCGAKKGVCDEGVGGTGRCDCVNGHVLGANCDSCDVGWSGDDCSIGSSAIGLQSLNYCGPKRLLAITFDNGVPTRALLDHLKSVHLVATFFISPGKESPPRNDSCSLVQRAINEGHEIQSGGYLALDLLHVSAAALDEETKRNEDWLRTCLSDGPSAITMQQIRPIAGHLDNGRARYLSDHGYIIASWNVDGAYGSAATMTAALQASPSAIVRFDMGVDPAALTTSMTVLANYLSTITPPYTIVTMGVCYRACTNGSGVCRDPLTVISASSPGVYER